MPRSLPRNPVACHARTMALRLSIVAGVVLVGCDWFVSAPEARARELVEVLIAEPENRPRLISLANVTDENQLAALYSTELDIELTYLRTRARQGASIDVTIRRVERSAPNQRKVQLDIAVKNPRRGIVLPGTQSDVTRVDVFLNRVTADEWRVREIQSVN